jgi:pimeloyl-[acyl-carrier protein] synthase
MSLMSPTVKPPVESDSTLSLYNLLDPAVLANPYPLFRRLRTTDPVHWDTFIHAWVVTRYADIVTVLRNFLAYKPASPETLATMGLSSLDPIPKMMMKQMLFMDPPAHTRLRTLAAQVFTPYRMERLRQHIKAIIDSLIDKVQDTGRMDVIGDLAEPLPSTVTAEMLGVPISDVRQLKVWSVDFAEMLGTFQHNPEGVHRVLQSLQGMTDYFRAAIREIRAHPREGLIHSLLTAEVDGDRLTTEEVVANAVITMVGGYETTTNLIGNGLLALLSNPEVLQDLRSDLSFIPSAVEELLRYEAPSQYTTRLAPEDFELGGKTIRKGQATVIVMAAGNRDPERFPDPDRIDIRRTDNRHLSFGWATHFCFGAPLARIEGQLAFEALLRRLTDLALEPGPLMWRHNMGLRGMKALPVTFKKAKACS